MISAKKLATIGAAAALLVLSASPAMAFGGRHGGSSGNSTSVDQSNFAGIVNLVSASSNTGDNKIESEGEENGPSLHSFRGGRRGGHNNDESGVDDSKIKTGDAATEVAVVNVANSNDADVEGCGCEENGGHSRRSRHGRSNSSSNRTSVDQSNGALILNGVHASSNTGDNKIEAEGGSVDDSKIVTGDASTGVAVVNVVNSNVATVN